MRFKTDQKPKLPSASQDPHSSLSLFFIFSPLSLFLSLFTSFRSHLGVVPQTHQAYPDFFGDCPFPAWTSPLDFHMATNQKPPSMGSLSRLLYWKIQSSPYASHPCYPHPVYHAFLSSIAILPANNYIIYSFMPLFLFYFPS